MSDISHIVKKKPDIASGICFYLLASRKGLLEFLCKIAEIRSLNRRAWACAMWRAIQKVPE
jgi:hypothetical protein